MLSRIGAQRAGPERRLPAGDVPLRCRTALKYTANRGEGAGRSAASTSCGIRSSHRRLDLATMDLEGSWVDESAVRFVQECFEKAALVFTPQLWVMAFILALFS